MTNKIMFGFLSLTAALTLTACAGNHNEGAVEESATQEVVQTNATAAHEGHEVNDEGHSHMNHSGSGDVPEGLMEAENPTFPIGSKAIIQADHMTGMKGAEATIVGAYNTIVYTVSYKPTTGGAPVTNHKWVIQEELEGVGKEPLNPGDEVILNADHMEGMKGATATIDSAEETTVYMVDYIATTGEKVKNHKWVTESELAAQ
ncbi:hypothetical protein CD30_17835 [Ureibacillus massiliensis 4400831 = CIP 108448 = CCUG 49529]|uniref:DUF1541 domain-containing protein n=1 Tax=Ureibacillus massiliensis 4400831 = CIP 108448 = CCUG 49529 TaxID=1211035 RepID=A0A0A3IWA7_9BACL|nr:YdhK family protein [Ureibacillus massiliensis]KGR88981.1 hypothetical protein CD30_17835 [Ureibacillus massiliensis 4400831 = CIP 108448 = CCUG 49529]